MPSGKRGASRDEVGPQCDDGLSHSREPPSLFEGLFDATPVPHLVIAENGAVLRRNPAFVRAFGEALLEGTVVSRDPLGVKWGVSAAVDGARHGEVATTAPFLPPSSEGTSSPRAYRCTAFAVSSAPHGPHVVALFLDASSEVLRRGRRESGSAPRRDADAQRSTEAAEHLLRLIADALPAKVAYIDMERRYRFNNKAYFTWLGLDPREICGKRVRDALGEEVYAYLDKNVEQALAGHVVRYETTLTLKDGRTAHVQPHYIPDRDEHGRTRGFVSLVLDITDIRRAEREVDAERKRLREILMQAPAAISIRTGPNHVFSLANPLFQELFDHRPLVGREAKEAIPEALQQLAILDHVRATGEVFSGNEVPFRIRSVDGSTIERSCNVTYLPLRNAEGNVDSVVSFAVDVTEQVKARKRAEILADALRASEARYRAFVGQSSEGICRFDLDEPLPLRLPVDEQVDRLFRGAFLAECNDAMARMLGYEHAEFLIGRRLTDFLDPRHASNAATFRAFVEAGYRLQNPEFNHTQCAGRRRVLEGACIGIIEGGLLARVWTTQRDVTAQVEAREQAEAANRAKDEFLAVLGHELRNPLAPILIAIDLMKLHGAQPFEKERAIIERQVKHSMRLVDDLLDVSRMTRGKVSIDRAPVHIENVLSVALELSSPLLEQHNHRLQAHVAPGMIVEGDATRLSQVFSNLINNAAKYTPPGGTVTVIGECDGDHARVRIRDTGIGIRSEILPTIFDLFVQERQSIERSDGGLGLGLAIVRSLVGLHGGTVEASSEGPGRGSEFTVTLPLADVPPESIETWMTDKPPPSDALRVLVVDDNADAAELLGEALVELGHVARIAHDGPTALKVLEEFSPDVALLDIGLPVMDGYELARRIREHQQFGDLHLIAVTGYGDASAKEAAKEAGFDEHVAKPVGLDALDRMLSRLGTTR